MTKRQKPLRGPSKSFRPRKVELEMLSYLQRKWKEKDVIATVRRCFVDTFLRYDGKLEVGDHGEVIVYAPDEKETS